MDFDKISEGYENKDNNFVYYYNREERIARAPKIVQDYYSGKFNVSKKGLFGTMFATRGNKFLFLSIIVIMIFGWCYSAYLNKTGVSFLGTTVKVSAFSFDETVYVSLELNQAKNKKNAGTPLLIDVVISVLDESGFIVDSYSERLQFTGDEINLKNKFHDYDLRKVVTELKTSDETKKMVTVIDLKYKG